MSGRAKNHLEDFEVIVGEPNLEPQPQPGKKVWKIWFLEGQHTLGYVEKKKQVSLCPYRSLRIPGRAFPGQDTVFPSITMCCLSSKISDHLGGAVPITVPVLLSWSRDFWLGEFQGFFFCLGIGKLAVITHLQFSPPSLGLILVQMITKSHHQCQLWQKSAGTGGPISEQVQHRVPHGTPKSDQEVYVPSPNSVFTSGSIAIVLAGLIQGSFFWWPL